LPKKISVAGDQLQPNNSGDNKAKEKETGNRGGLTKNSLYQCGLA